MKINEKTLINFSTSNVPADREGWLFKRGEVSFGERKQYNIAVTTFNDKNACIKWYYGSIQNFSTHGMLV